MLSTCITDAVVPVNPVMENRNHSVSGGGKPLENKQDPLSVWLAGRPRKTPGGTFSRESIPYHGLWSLPVLTRDASPRVTTIRLPGS
jgi:hypothetical protein